MRARKLFALAGVLFLLAIGLAVVHSTVIEPGYEDVFACADPGTPSSGFTDASQGDCPISIESYNEWRDLTVATDPLELVGRAVGILFLLVFLAAVVIGIYNVVRSRRGSSEEKDSTPA